jgi:hypothetical protein
MHADSIITLGLLNQNMDVTRQYKLIGCYPTTVGELSYDVAGTGEPLTFTATLAYQYWTRSIL